MNFVLGKALLSLLFYTDNPYFFTTFSKILPLLFPYFSVDGHLKACQCILVYCSSPLIWYATWPCPESLIFDPSPMPQGAGTQKSAGACAIHVSNSHTKFGWISGKKNWPPTPPLYPKSHSWAWPRRLNENPVWNVIYLSFVRRYTKFGFQI